MAALLGDALGVPYEFHVAESLPPLSLIRMKPPAGFERSHWRVPPGTWSDDGAQMLALLDCLQTRHPFDPDAFAKGLLAWWRKGTYAVDGQVFDIGVQTEKALGALDRGVFVLDAGPSLEADNGNGSLMRVLPVSFFDWTEAELVRVARAQSRLTHGHLRAQLCCALYTLLAHELIHGARKEAAMERAIQSLTRLVAPSERAELSLILHHRHHHKPQGSGYVVDSLWSAWHVFEHAADIEQGLRQAVALGNDTDTTASLAGGLLGAHFGKDAIPQDMWAQLRGKALLMHFLLKLD